MLFLILSSLGVVSCSTITVYNDEFCTELTRERAKCDWTIEGPIRYIEAPEWRRERIGRVSMTPEGYGNMLMSLEKACLRIKCVVKLPDGTETEGLPIIQSMIERHEKTMVEIDMELAQ